VSDGLVPVTVNVPLPIGAPAVALIVIVDVPDPARVEGLKLADVPKGRLDALRVTVSVKPLSAWTVTR
jgi:hypothetical protein